jgi:antitoxin VapB
MAVLIKDAEADRIVRELAARTGETITEAVRVAAEERLARLPKATGRIDRAELDRVLARIRSYPVTDARTPDEILGYDETGLPA